MIPNRREFLERLASLPVLSAVPFTLDALPAPDESVQQSKWDLSWTRRITGKYRAVFDVPEIESGYGVWRATIWAGQYMETLKAAPSDLSSVVVLRHSGIALAMSQPYWDKYGVGKARSVVHPVTEEPTDRNPVLLSSSRNEVPAQMDAFALDQYIKRGGIVLACDLAFNDVIGTIVKADKVSPEAARTQALAALVPGVIMQPSGVFGALYAQEFGCKYIRAS
ncbi:MAG: hypothetical protein ABIW79_03095 [Gemmatimonas sp.]